MKPFIILTFQRTGSTYFRIWLNTHPLIRTHGELFLLDSIHADGFRRHCYDHYGLGKIHYTIYAQKVLRKLRMNYIPDKYVDQFIERFRYSPDFPGPWLYDKCSGVTEDDNKPWVGFKAMYQHVKGTPRLGHIIDEQNFAIIHLTRDNLLKQYVSLSRMIGSTVSHSTTDVKKTAPVMLDIKKMFRHFKSMNGELEAMRARYQDRKRYLEFSYETFFNDPTKVGNQITDLFEIERAEMQNPKLKKTSTNSLEEEIANADEVVKALKGTEFDHFLKVYS